MYYRVAIQREGDHQGQSPLWKWHSTPLGSLNSVLSFFHYYHALPLDRLRVFSSPSREGLQEQLVQENQGLGSLSVTAAHFLQERLIRSPAERRGTPERQGGASQQMASIAAAPQPAAQMRRWGRNDLVGSGLSALESRRLELELGPGGDHDVPYRFVLPTSMPQVLAWMRLLARIRQGELHP
jgi:hypothetical protein